MWCRNEKKRIKIKKCCNDRVLFIKNIKNKRKINKNCCRKWNIKNFEEYEKTYKKIIKKFEEYE